MGIKMFFDFHLHENEELIYEAGRLGYAGIAIIRHDMNGQNSSNNIPVIDNKIKNEKYLNIYSGVEISANNPDDLKKKIQRFKKKAKILMVHGGDLKINREACENPRVDILSHPYRNRRDSGINHVMGRKAAEKNVAIELNLKYLFKIRPSHRHRVLSQFKDILKLHRKFNFPLIITSGAHSIYDLHTPRDIMALTNSFGLNREETICALSQTPQNIIKRRDLGSKVIVAGARIKSQIN